MLEIGTVAIMGALSVGPVVGASKGVELEWSAPDSCPSAEIVRMWLATALADSAASPGGIRAIASVSEHESGLTLDLQLERPDSPIGRRTIQARDCEALARTAVLIVALAADPEATIAALPEETFEPTTPQEPREAEIPDTVVVEVPTENPPATNADRPEAHGRADPTRLHVGLRAQAAAGLSVLPAPGPVISVVTAFWGGAWRAELGATYWTPVDSLPDGRAGGRIQQWTLDMRGCALLRPSRLEIPLCGGVDVGATHGQGLNLVGPRRVTSLRLAFATSTALIWRPRRLEQRLGLWIGGDLLISLVRARFRANPAATTLVYYTPPVGGRVGAGVEIRFR